MSSRAEDTAREMRTAAEQALIDAAEEARRVYYLPENVAQRIKEQAAQDEIIRVAQIEAVTGMPVAMILALAKDPDTAIVALATAQTIAETIVLFHSEAVAGLAQTAGESAGAGADLLGALGGLLGAGVGAAVAAPGVPP